MSDTTRSTEAEKSRKRHAARNKMETRDVMFQNAGKEEEEEEDDDVHAGFLKRLQNNSCPDENVEKFKPFLEVNTKLLFGVTVSPVPIIKCVAAFARTRHPLFLVYWMSAGQLLICYTIYIIFWNGFSSASFVSSLLLLLLVTPVWVFLMLLLPQKAGVFAEARLEQEIRSKANVYFRKSGLGDRIMREHNAEDVRATTKSENACFWLLTGDSQMLIPHVFIQSIFSTNLKYTKRFYIETEDDELIATDWAFPAGGYSENNSTILILLHGLNGGSQSPFVVDCAKRAVEQGFTVCVLVSRGSCGTFLKKHMFHGVRVTDLHAVATYIRKCALLPKTLLIAAGFSMGAITIGLYLARYGEKAVIDGGVSISGCMDAIKNKYFTYALQVYHGIIATNLKFKCGGRLGEVLKETGRFKPCQSGREGNAHDHRFRCGCDRAPQRF